MKLAVVGGRNLDCKNRVYFELNELRKTAHIEQIISGDCPTGIDKFAKEYAMDHGIPYRGFPADWSDFSDPCNRKKNSRGEWYNALAGLKRNTVIADECDKGMVFWDGKSTGTRDVGKKIHARGKLLKKIIIP